MASAFLAIKKKKLTTANVGHRSLGFSWTDTMAQINPATVSVGNQKIATRYTGPARLRIAHRITLLLAVATLLVSMVSGQRMMLDILATIFFAAVIIIRVISLNAVAAKRDGPAFKIPT